jgi:hypothetical protein
MPDTQVREDVTEEREDLRVTVVPSDSARVIVTVENRSGRYTFTVPAEPLPV